MLELRTIRADEIEAAKAMVLLRVGTGADRHFVVAPDAPWWYNAPASLR